MFFRSRCPGSYKLICGLGNPGPSYAHTRHNVGFQVVSLLARQEKAGWVGCKKLARYAVVKLEGCPAVLVQPLTFMNLSGLAVAPLMKRWRVSLPQLLVVSDDLDLPEGAIRIRPGGGSGGHRGVQSIIDQLGSEDFPRLRVGIGRPEAGVDPADYVLRPFPWEQREKTAATIEAAAEAVRVWVAAGTGAAMNRCNRRS